MIGRSVAYALLAAYMAALALAVKAHAKLPPVCLACWDRVAACESNGRWWLASGNGYYGGLQFLPSTWRAYGGTRYAAWPHLASRPEQIQVAARMSLSNWPVCGSRYWG